MRIEIFMTQIYEWRIRTILIVTFDFITPAIMRHRLVIHCIYILYCTIRNIYSAIRQLKCLFIPQF